MSIMDSKNINTIIFRPFLSDIKHDYIKSAILKLSDGSEIIISKKGLILDVSKYDYKDNDILELNLLAKYKLLQNGTGSPLYISVECEELISKDGVAYVQIINKTDKIGGPFGLLSCLDFISRNIKRYNNLF